jgi:MarR family protein
MAGWQFLSNHGRVLVYVAREPKARLRDIAEAVGITERSAHRIVSELCEDGYLSRKQNGRRNHYEVRPDVSLRDPLLGDHWIGEILAVVAGTTGWANGGRPGRRARASSSRARTPER